MDWWSLFYYFPKYFPDNKSLGPVEGRVIFLRESDLGWGWE